MTPDNGQILIAGAGIAGLTAALAFARKGFHVNIFERSPELEEVGAGLQLSPNATRILDRLGVLKRLSASAVRPEEIVIRRADSLRVLSTVPLGVRAEQRWGAPYLTVHRGDLQAALAETVAEQDGISLHLGAAVEGLSATGDRVSLELAGEIAPAQAEGLLLVGADGVWSRMRQRMNPSAASRYSGYVAWRAVTTNPGTVFPSDRVTTFLSPRFHLVAYPIRGGRAVNLVAVMRASAVTKSWSSTADSDELLRAMTNVDKSLFDSVRNAGNWTTWPIHEVPVAQPWTDYAKRMALIGDAAHAVSPYAAQGSAMAIEDAAVLSRLVADCGSDIASALSQFETLRRPRVARVAKRGAFNRFAWHAAGPIAFARDRVLRLRAPERLAADMDWLYGADVEQVSR